MKMYCHDCDCSFDEDDDFHSYHRTEQYDNVFPTEKTKEESDNTNKRPQNMNTLEWCSLKSTNK